MMSGTHQLDAATELPLVQGLSDVTPEVIREVAALASPRRLFAQGHVVRQGQVAEGLFVLVRGAVKVVRCAACAPGDVVRVIDVMRAPCVVPDNSVFDGLPSAASIVTLRASDFFVLERRALLHLMATHASLDRALFAWLVRESRRAMGRLDELVAGSVKARVQCLLEGLAAEYGTPLGAGRFIALPLRRHELASMINATTETVSRLLAQLERDGDVRSTRDGIWLRSVKPKATG